MNNLSRCIALSLFMGIVVGFCSKVSAQKQAEVNITVTEPAPGESPGCEDKTFAKQLETQSAASEIVELYYIRSASTMVAILKEIAKVNPCLGRMVINSQGNNAIVLYGKEAQRNFLKRVVAMLDLRREGVDMAMWGILVSSDNPGELSQAMREINKEITRTRELLLDTYLAFEEKARTIEVDSQVQNLFTQLGYPNALNPNRPYLSMTDILLRISAARNPDENYRNIAENLCNIFQDDKYLYYTQELDKRPFSNYLDKVIPGVENDYGDQCNNYQYNSQHRYLARSFRRRKAILDFALNYAHFAQKPNEFDPKALQKSAENLNSFLSPIVDAINRDVEELFIEPTLKRIQEIVGEFWDVSYAEVGRTKVVGLNGIPSSVKSTTVSAFDETGPFRANELLEEAGRLNEFSKDLFPSLAAEAVPASSVVSLVAALSKDRSLFRALTSGVSLEVTPSVLRNSTSAELEIDLITAPQSTQEVTGDGEVKPLSRISQNTVTTTVYVNTLDLFTLSTFNSQTTIDGGRTYIPVIGTIWQGIFSGVPIFGELFSWKNHPKNVQHQSIVLTNSFIVPTAMGLAPLHDRGRVTDLYNACNAVNSYVFSQERRLQEIKEEEDRTFLNRDSSETQVFGQPPSFTSPMFGVPTSSFSECDKFRVNPQ